MVGKVLFKCIPAEAQTIGGLELGEKIGDPNWVIRLDIFSHIVVAMYLQTASSLATVLVILLVIARLARVFAGR